jgi:tRNA nucleotidyltransferase (CCA-adding enzyme)
MSILINYVDDVLIPTKNQIELLKSKAKSILNVLTKNSSLTPKEVHIGGSLEKGTMLKNKLDIDLVYIYNKSAEIGNNWKKLVTVVYNVLKNNFPEIEIEEAGNLAIHIKLHWKNYL